MFGTNPTAPARDTEKTFLVKSIFNTIQGEGPYAGYPATFIRLGGCNLKCSFCDTDFTSDLKEMLPDEICLRVMRIEERFNRLIVITGGEPMLQNLALLITAISKMLPHVTVVQIETAGTVWPTGLIRNVDAYSPRVDIVVSPKTPKVNKQVSEVAMYWKYLIDTGAAQRANDDLPVDMARPGRPDAIIYVQPMDVLDPVKNKANMEMARDISLKRGYLISLQQHKILGVE